MLTASLLFLFLLSLASRLEKILFFINSCHKKRPLETSWLHLLAMQPVVRSHCFYLPFGFCSATTAAGGAASAISHLGSSTWANAAGAVFPPRKLFQFILTEAQWWHQIVLAIEHIIGLPVKIMIIIIKLIWEGQVFCPCLCACNYYFLKYVLISTYLRVPWTHNNVCTKVMIFPPTAVREE